MKCTKFFALLTTTAIGFAAASLPVAAQDDVAKPTISSDDYVIMSYDDDGKVYRSDLDRMWNSMFPSPDAPEFDSFDVNVQKEILRNVARERLILDKAYDKNLDKSDEVKNQIANLKRQVMIQAYFKSIMDDLVPESEIKKQYGVLKEKYAGKQEVKASHILVETKEEADEIYTELTENGADFAELAKEKSVDTGSGARGGDLGFFTKERMVPEFAEAAYKLSKGEISKPVQSDFGWHIIKMEDKRDLAAPAYETVKPEMQKMMANDAIETYVRNVIAEADLKFYGPDGDELPEVAAPAEADDAEADATDEESAAE